VAIDSPLASSASSSVLQHVRGGGISASAATLETFHKRFKLFGGLDASVVELEKTLDSNKKEGSQEPEAWQYLSKEERVVLWMYTKQYYRFVNPALFTNNIADIEKFKDVIQLLDLALAKLPPFKGTVFRGEAWDAGRHKAIEKDFSFEVPAFFSTSSSITVTGSADFAGGIVFQISEPHGGRLIEHASLKFSEHEVLFGRGSKFIVKSKTGDHDKKQQVKVELSPV
jgi:hypothetical protein